MVMTTTAMAKKQAVYEKLKIKVFNADRKVRPSPLSERKPWLLYSYFFVSYSTRKLRSFLQRTLRCRLHHFFVFSFLGFMFSQKLLMLGFEYLMEHGALFWILGFVFERNGISGDIKLLLDPPGLSEFTGNEADWSKFRVPTLRNISKTAPHLHDGRVADLTTLVTLYNRIQNLQLNEQERADMEAFLRSLDDSMP